MKTENISKLIDLNSRIASLLNEMLESIKYEDCKYHLYNYNNDPSGVVVFKSFDKPIDEMEMTDEDRKERGIDEDGYYLDEWGNRY